MTYAPNKRVACKPFDSTSIEIEKKKGFATAKNVTSLWRTSVIWPDENGQYNPGDLIYVNPDVKPLGWCDRVYELGGTPFILVPVEHIQIVVTKE